MRFLLKTIVILSALTVSQLADDWPRWRGANGFGITLEKNLPSELSPEKNLTWKLDLPGWGNSSPIILGNRLYLTTQIADTSCLVIAINRETGKLIWSTKVASGKLKTHDFHNMATPTPVSDGENIWALFGTGDLVCLDESGDLVWKRQLQKDHGEYKIGWGMGTSPILHNGNLYIACMQAGPSYLLAIDGQTGKDLWKKERNLGATDESQDSYSSPILVPTKSGPQLVLAGENHINAYDPATGKQIWIAGGMEVPHEYGRTIAAPTAGDGIVIGVASGWGNKGFIVALKTDGRGSLSENDRLWKVTRYSPDCPTPLVYNGFVFLVRDDGIASCLDLKTGEPKWQERLFTDNVKVSPIAGDGKVYFTSGRATCTVINAGPELKILSTNKLNEDTLCTPAISNGKLFIRTRERLYAFGRDGAE